MLVVELPKAICDCCNLLTNEFFKQAVQIEIDAGRQPMSVRVKRNLAKPQKLPDRQGQMYCGGCANDITEAIHSCQHEINQSVEKNKLKIANE